MKAMRAVIYVMLIAVLCFIPMQRLEIADLDPVQAVWVHRMDDRLILRTDTGAIGVGETIEEALDDMKRRSSKIIYLDTAQYLLVSEAVKEEIPSLYPYLRRTVRVSQWSGEGNIKDAVQYVDTHKFGEKLSCWAKGSNLPELPLIN